MSGGQVSCRVPSKCVLRSPPCSRRSNRVVIFEKTPCKEPYRNLKETGSAFGTSLRVCTGRIRGMYITCGVCPPKLCDCPPTKCLKPGDTFKKNLKLFIKSGLLGAVIYHTYERGIWSDPEKTAVLTQDYLEWAREFFYTMNKIDRSGEEIYDMRRIKYNLKHVWNNIVFFLTELGTLLPVALRKTGDGLLPKRSGIMDEKTARQRDLEEAKKRTAAEKRKTLTC